MDWCLQEIKPARVQIAVSGIPADRRSYGNNLNMYVRIILH